MDINTVHLMYAIILQSKLVTLENKDPLLESEKFSSSQLNLGRLRCPIRILIVMAPRCSCLLKRIQKSRDAFTYCSNV